MGMGMIGAIGGVGTAMSNESKFLERRDEKNDDLARSKDLQGWLLQQQEQYAIRTEGRTDTRAEAAKDRDFARTQAEAPARRDIKVGDEVAMAKGKSGAALDTLPADATVAATLADAKQTTEDKAVKRGTARQHEATASYYEGAKTTEAEARAAAAAAGKGGGKMDPLVAEEARSLREQINKATEQINAQRVQGGGAWDPDKNPSQKQMLTELGAMRLRHDALVSGGGTARPDPLGMRGGGAADKPAGMIGGQPYTMKSGRGAEPAPNVQGEGKFNTADPGLRAGIDNIADPQERANARNALANQTAPIVPASGAAQPAAASTATVPVAQASTGRGTAPTRAPAGKPSSEPDKSGGVLDYLSGLSQDFDSPAGRLRVRMRVHDAATGGKPLSAVERLRAQQLGLLQEAGA